MIMQSGTSSHELRHPVQKQVEGEWSLEQGFATHLTVLDQTVDEDGNDPDGIPINDPGATGRQDVEAPYIEDPDTLFAEEREGWRGYVEWEAYPEKKDIASRILRSQTFPPPPEFQLEQVPATNPVLEGVRWKMWHKAIGGPLSYIPEESWLRVVQEKHPDMLHLLQFPYNGEPPKRLVTAKTITPTSLMFVRNHGGIPDIDADKWDLKIDGLVRNPKTLTLAELQDDSIFPRISKVATIQCSGTRRVEQIGLYAGEGDEMINAPWAEGAIGTATYTGVSLKRVIKHCGGLIDGAKHLEFFGADTYFKQNEVMNYAVSVPWTKVKANEVLLVWEMNEKPLMKIHGFPLRVVVLGYIGARSVKWLYNIRAIERPTTAPVQSKEYLYFNQQVGKHNQAPVMGIQIQEMPVSSAIMEPWTKQTVIHRGKVHVKGWAYSGGGRWPERVEVSADGGFSWYEVPQENMSKKYRFAWRTWEIDLPCEVEGWIEIVSRTWDNALNTQPLEIRSAWNWGLHVTSSCHRIKVYSVNKKRERTMNRLKDFKKHKTNLAPITRPTEFPTMDMEDYKHYWATAEPRDVED